MGLYTDCSPLNKTPERWGIKVKICTIDLFLARGRIAKLAKCLDLQCIDRRFEPCYRRGAVVLVRPSVSPSLEIASVGLDQHGKKGGPNQWIIRVNTTLQLLKIHLSLLKNSSRVSAGDV